MSVMGTRVQRREDPAFLTGANRYVADLRDPHLEGAVHVHFVRSTMAHARLAEVDVSEAVEAPGVVAVYTAADTDGADDLGPFGVAIPGMIPDGLARSWITGDVVRFVGDVVAVIVAESKEQAEDAAELVIVDYDPLDAVVDPVEAEKGELLLFPEHGSNVALEVPFGHSGDELFEGCEVVVDRTITNQRLAVCPLEPRGLSATWADGRLVVWVSTQAPHGVKGKLAGLYGLEPDQVHVIAPAVGGGFGAKINLQSDEALLPWISRRLGRPVTWIETRGESMLSMPHGRGQVLRVEIGGGRDGKVEAYRLTVLQDAGAYPGMGAFLPFMTRTMAPGTYAFPKVECNVKAVMTNTTPIEAYRGAGRPEATAAVERALDLFAAEIGMDPVEVRRRNLIPADAFPFTTPTGAVYDVGDYAKALDLALAEAGYDELRAEQASRRAAGDPVQLGIGVAVYVEITAGPAGNQGEFAKVALRRDGGITVYTGASAHGQGHSTAWAMLAHDLTGIPMDQIDVVAGDTDKVTEGHGTFGSRSLQLGGSAVWTATEQVVEKARAVAAELLEASAADIVLDTDRGAFHVAGTPTAARSWAEVGAAGDITGPIGEAPTGLPIEVGLTFTAENATFPFGAHVAVVEVDTETGQTRLRRIVTCDDAGRILNPLIVEGQRHGGIAQGVAQALWEEVRYDDDGNPQTANLADYAFPSAAELPSFDLVPLETPSPVNPLGAKGIGESGAIGATPAVQSAVLDALTPFGVDHLDMPLTAEKVWRAVSGI
jgi:carbon-monoxide dehydrogenase large subunit